MNLRKNHFEIRNEGNIHEECALGFSRMTNSPIDATSQNGGYWISYQIETEEVSLLM
jgi:hypothetical protein